MEKNLTISRTYPNLYELDGSILDEESYQKHVQSQKAPADQASSGSFSSGSGSSSGSGFLGGYGLHLIAP